MKKTTLLSVLLCLALLLESFVAPVAAANLQTVPPQDNSSAQETQGVAPASHPFGTVCIHQGCRTIEAGVPLGTSERILETAQAGLAEIVTGMIADIGTVTLDSKDAIAAAQAAYDSLTEGSRTLVANYADLEVAAAKLSVMEQADAVTKMIADIGTVTLDSEEALDAAQDAYDSLPDEAKELVENYADLEAAFPEFMEIFTEEFGRLNEAVFAISDAMEIYDTVTMAALIEEYLPIAEKITSSSLYFAEADLFTALKDTQDLLEQVCYPNTNIITLNNYLKLVGLHNILPDPEDGNLFDDDDTGMDALRYPFDTIAAMNSAFQAYQRYVNTYFDLVDQNISPASSTYFYGMTITIASSQYFYEDDLGNDFYIRWEYKTVDGSLLACMVDVGFDPEVGLSAVHD